ncbi:FAD-binding oxidoreductase [Defluviimonas sp. WL0024]|uniref:FAD-binding oxidoreductase n=1 Tax=Albidovulum salinarum TaxID=2984153 RepID=A0ABT2WZV4_9RHOB|nr:FAD-binding oxidoreductase [Defluviimonas sp. WL0024]MCU9847211.1 FAD-binding oxidoreductase [Defluviimonas sp. WL0024]
MLNPADAAFAQRLATLLPEGTLAPAEPRYLEEPRRRAVTPQALLARPRETAEVARIVSACAQARVGLIPWGGGTGLVLGQVQPEGPAPVILSLERMNRLRGLWPEENLMIVEAGMTLAEVQAAADGAGRLFPLSLASEGTARIGGNLATNAGGTAVLRYGNARELCLGVEAVLPDGSVLNGLTRLRKDNTGYDLKDLLIGSEGTLGVITAATLRLFPQPAATATALLAVIGPEAALELLTLAQIRTGGAVTTFELIHAQGLLFLDEAMPELRQPFADRPDWSVLIEIGLAPGLDPEVVMTGLYEAAEAGSLVRDGVIAQSGAQARALWDLREALPEGNRRIGAVVSHDISLPLSEIAEFLRRAGPVIAAIGPFRVNCFGHLGDGNLHYNVFPPKGGRAADHRDKAGSIQRAVHDLVHALGGSVSAEHGIGRLKTRDLEAYGDPAKLAAMRAIKAALDPAGIMNPGAVLAP